MEQNGPPIHIGGNNHSFTHLTLKSPGFDIQQKRHLLSLQNRGFRVEFGHAGNNLSFLLTQIKDEFEKFLRVRHLLNRKDLPDSNVQSIKVYFNLECFSAASNDGTIEPR